MARAFAAAGCDLIDVSSGQTVPDAAPVYGRMFQTPFSDQIRNEAGLATMCVGAITSAYQVNTIIAAGRADLVALARPHLEFVLPRPQQREPRRQLHTVGNRAFRQIDVPADVRRRRVDVDVTGKLAVFVTDHRRPGRRNHGRFGTHTIPLGVSQSAHVRPWGRKTYQAPVKAMSKRKNATRHIGRLSAVAHAI